jgi:ribonuclease P protein component
LFRRRFAPAALKFDANASHDMSFFSFRKDEILRRKKLIDRLFAEGFSFFTYPFKIFWLATPVESEHPAQILITVSKRTFKHATDRNRIKRQIREAYRHHKHHLYQCLEKLDAPVVIAFIYTANTPLTSPEIETKIKAAMKRLSGEIEKKLNNPSSSLSDKIKYTS